MWAYKHDYLRQYAGLSMNVLEILTDMEIALDAVIRAVMALMRFFICRSMLILGAMASMKPFPT